MERRDKVFLAKKIVKELSSQGITVKDLNDICDLVKAIASNEKRGFWHDSGYLAKPF